MPEEVAVLQIAQRTYLALRNLFPYADLSELMRPRNAVALSEQLSAAMWRLRGMRDAIDQLAKWNTPDEDLSMEQQRFSQEIIVAFATCAENLRLLNPDWRSIPVPDWKPAWGVKKKSKRKKPSKSNGASLLPRGARSSR